MTDLPFQNMPCTVCKKKWNYLTNLNGAAIYCSAKFNCIPPKYKAILHDHCPKDEPDRIIRMMFLLCSRKCFELFVQKLNIIKPSCYCCVTGDLTGKKEFIAVENHKIPAEDNVYSDFIVMNFLCSKECQENVISVQDLIETQLYKHVKEDKEFMSSLRKETGEGSGSGSGSGAAAASVAAVSSPGPGNICSLCGKDGIFSCSRCKKVFYCSKDCQKDDWKKKHRGECS